MQAQKAERILTMIL